MKILRGIIVGVIYTLGISDLGVTPARESLMPQNFKHQTSCMLKFLRGVTPDRGESVNPRHDLIG